MRPFFLILCKNTLKSRQMDNFLENKNLLKLILVETDSPNGSITIGEIK